MYRPRPNGKAIANRSLRFPELLQLGQDTRRLSERRQGCVDDQEEGARCSRGPHQLEDDELSLHFLYLPFMDLCHRLGDSPSPPDGTRPASTMR
jgi:hypothetical protein